MARRSNARRCNHCGRPGKLKASRSDPTNELCPKCWDRFGGRGPIANPAAGRRRARQGSGS